MLIMAGRKREWRAQTRQKLRRLVMLARQSEPPGSVAAALGSTCAPRMAKCGREELHITCLKLCRSASEVSLCYRL